MYPKYITSNSVLILFLLFSAGAFTLNNELLLEVISERTIIILLFISLTGTLMLLSIIFNKSKKFEYISQVDTLTNIPNRRNFNTKFEYLAALNTRSKIDSYLVYMDIDNFKIINDSLGHQCGDKVLIEFAKILKNNVRKSDLIARYGGEEFIIAFSGSTLQIAKALAEKIRLCVTNSIEIQNIVYSPVTISLGLTLIKEHDSLSTAVLRADKAMYQAKSTGKNKVCVL
ncbi:GGDEF domain-containing protein [Sulfurimonas sp. SAG-AH-194-C20]|nr:GGDEF domain-containing protein [Sulfurimonas sp. SAG-AH-194-C20]MDF1878164.1 GGDEF domain-containing protein [Sulfurimonas sp. SAG-AH-194-C20]